MFTSKYLNVIGVIVGQSFTKANTLYFGVSTSAINADGSGISEPSSGSGYARYAIINNTTNWTMVSDGVFTNALSIKMNDITSDSGVATYWFLSETVDGNAVIFDKFENPRPLVTNSNIYINPNELKIGLKNIVA